MLVHPHGELLDRVGWDQAAEVLPSLIGNLARAQRSEELLKIFELWDRKDAYVKTFGFKLVRLYPRDFWM